MEKEDFERVEITNNLISWLRNHPNANDDDLKFQIKYIYCMGVNQGIKSMTEKLINQLELKNSKVKR